MDNDEELANIIFPFYTARRLINALNVLEVEWRENYAEALRQNQVRKIKKKLFIKKS
jgi:hypothetical protein